MQISKINAPFVLKNPTISKTPDKQGVFADSLETGLKQAAKTKANTGKPTISLGTISYDRPTVSHLLVNHPDYSRECWEIIHSESNHDKPYTRIPAGTEILLNTETKEITWNSQSSKDDQLINHSISRAAANHNLSQELIRSVIRAESNFDVNALSRAGAMGLMQLMPDTARELGISNPFDIRQNIEGGAKYLKQMMDLFDGDLRKSLAAYNAGPGTVRRFNGEVPYKETRDYVERVLSFLTQR